MLRFKFSTYDYILLNSPLSTVTNDTDNVPFGIPPNSDRNSAKNVLYPTLEEDSSR